MEIQFTHHALLRMQQRAITEDEVYGIFQNRVIFFDKKAHFIIGKTLTGRFLTLIMEKSKKRLLTLWPSSRQERQLYRQKTENLL